MLDLPDSLANLISYDPAIGTVTTRESKRLEFKRDFARGDFSDYTKIMASFANASGGVIVFGVSDSPLRIEGCAAFADEADWANRLREDFDPEIPFAIRSYEVGTVTLYAVGVGSSRYKPVLCRKTRTKQIGGPKGNKDIEVLREGSIYYRYAGQSRPINFPDLHGMLADRESQYLRKMMETLQVVQKVGLANAGVLDMSSSKSSVYMSKETARSLNFIDKANIVQEKGAPAYVVMGNVDLKQIVHAPLDDDDKNIPTEAARLLTPVVNEVYGEAVPIIHAPQVTAILKHLGIHDDNQHCVNERKLGRKYITRAGLKAVETFIRENPAEALEVFGSRASRLKYGLEKVRAKAKDGALGLIFEGTVEPDALDSSLAKESSSAETTTGPQVQPSNSNTSAS